VVGRDAWPLPDEVAAAFEALKAKAYGSVKLKTTGCPGFCARPLVTSIPKEYFIRMSNQKMRQKLFQQLKK
jgi:NADH:ubiquinone oxidoreductase subunit E